MAVGDVYQAVVVQELDNQTLLNVLYYDAVTEPSNPSGLAAAINDTLLPLWTPFLNDDLHFVRIDVSKILPLPRSFLLSLATVASGQLLTTALPTSVAVTITKQTPFAGRSFRGRWYLGGVDQSLVAESQLLPTGVSLVQTLATELANNITDGSGGEYRPGYLRTAGPPPTAQVFQPITGTRVNPILRNQRRRQIGVGI